ncbi:MAG TPA: translation initiation factor IF-3 [Verrucomicrobiae bacterium]|nr:translation initiation factor IF-3 [Verrucomicrobiae bacterium]
MNTNSKTRIRANNQIRVPEVRLIGSDGSQLGIVATRDALLKAEEEGLDLVEVAPNVKPPVCRLMDLGKYVYSLDKKEKEARKKQKVIHIKEVKMTPKIEEHDYQTKLRNSRKFIENGDKVKLTLIFRGREITHKELGDRIIQKFIQDISDIADVERNEGLEGNAFLIYFAAKPATGKKAAANQDANAGTNSQE